MLSKSQARTFFLGGTVVTFLVFIGLTVYSFMPSNDQTNHELIDHQVVRGKELWENNNCMGCHTIMGEGGYYAPELTKSCRKTWRSIHKSSDAVAGAVGTKR